MAKARILKQIQKGRFRKSILHESKLERKIFLSVISQSRSLQRKKGLEKNVAVLQLLKCTYL
jgi:ketol-acid reductoisomerase